MSESTAQAIRNILEKCIVAEPKPKPKKSVAVHKVRFKQHEPSGKYSTSLLVRFTADAMICEGECRASGARAYVIWTFPRPVGVKGIPDDTAFRISTREWKKFRKLTESGLAIKIGEDGIVSVGAEHIGAVEEWDESAYTLDRATPIGSVTIAPGLNICQTLAGVGRNMDFYLWFCKIGDRIGLASTDSHRLHIQFDCINADESIVDTAVPAWFSPCGEATIFQLADSHPKPFDRAMTFDNIVVYVESPVGGFPSADKVISHAHDLTIDVAAAEDAFKIAAGREYAPSHKTVIREDGAVVAKPGEIAKIIVPKGFKPIGFNASYMLDAMKFSGSSTVKVQSEGINPFAIGNDRLAVVMPIVINDTDPTPSDQSADPSPDTHAE